jgi:hypothetical protein
MTIRTITIYENIRAIYIAVPKTANTSIKTHLHYLNSGVVLDNPHAESAPIKTLQPSDLDAAIRCTNLIFTFVRNPWDRLLSVWADKCGPNTDISLLKWGISQGITFDSFVDRVVRIPDDTADIHFQSQTYLTFSSDFLLPSFIGRFESLTDDWNRVVSLLKLDSDHRKLGLPIRRKSEHGPYRDYYSKATASAVGRRYAADVKMFGYTF